MPSLEFSQEELQNLSVFLSRVQLSGQEVPAFLPIMGKVQAGLVVAATKGSSAPGGKQASVEG